MTTYRCPNSCAATIMPEKPPVSSTIATELTFSSLLFTTQAPPTYAKPAVPRLHSPCLVFLRHMSSLVLQRGKNYCNTRYPFQYSFSPNILRSACIFKLTLLWQQQCHKPAIFFLRIGIFPYLLGLRPNQSHLYQHGFFRDMALRLGPMSIFII